MSNVITTDSISQAARKDGYQITVDLDKCISAGPCAISAPLVFLLRESDGKAIIGDPDGDDIEKVMEAARSCPVLAIIVKDKLGRTVFP